MAKKQPAVIERLPEYVTCEGCIFIDPYSNMIDHGMCKEPHVRMIQVISNPKPCIWKKMNNG